MRERTVLFFPLRTTAEIITVMLDGMVIKMSIGRWFVIISDGMRVSDLMSCIFMVEKH